MALLWSVMGTKMAPSFANLFLGIFETNALSNAPFHPHTWWRSLDDVFMIWTEGLDHLKIFVDYLNNVHPTIKFTSTCNHSLRYPVTSFHSHFVPSYGHFVPKNSHFVPKNSHFVPRNIHFVPRNSHFVPQTNSRKLQSS